MMPRLEQLKQSSAAPAAVLRRLFLGGCWVRLAVADAMTVTMTRTDGYAKRLAEAFVQQQQCSALLLSRRKVLWWLRGVSHWHRDTRRPIRTSRAALVGGHQQGNNEEGAMQLATAREANCDLNSSSRHSPEAPAALASLHRSAWFTRFTGS